MKVSIDWERVIVGDASLEYYPYYFGIWDREIDYRLTVKEVLFQWASALTKMAEMESEVYLPYSLDDETCRFLKAVSQGSEVILTDITAWANGWAMSLDDLSEHIYTKPDIVENSGAFKDSTKYFGRYDRQMLIEALLNAEIIGS